MKRASAPSYLLDTYPTTKSAFSVRLISSTYAGNCIRVRRSSDNTEQNIGFSSGILDTASLISFVGAANGFVTTWYDQSGNNYNMIQPIAAKQPKIVNSGNLLTVNSKPIIRFQSSGLYNLMPSLSMPFSIFTVLNSNATLSGNYFLYSNATPIEAYGSTIGFVSSNWRIQDINGNISLPGISLTGNTNGILSTCMPSYTSININKNNTSLFSGSINSSISAFNLTSLGYRDNLGGTFYSDQDIQEAIIWGSNQNINTLNINTNINNYYGIY
jgi:hypothetical protein